jgi:hypothetical protein
MFGPSCDPGELDLEALDPVPIGLEDGEEEAVVLDGVALVRRVAAFT